MEKSSPYNKTVDESKHQSMEKALEILFQEQGENEKRSVVVRPAINVRNGIIKILITVSALVCMHILMTIGAAAINSPIGIVIAIDIVVVCGLLILFLKRLVIWGVKVYQKYAPETLRKSCVFEPSCSEYMILAIEKFGALRGIYKGIKRLFRCHHPNGGIDNP